jgi:hypothetical protein
MPFKNQFLAGFFLLWAAAVISSCKDTGTMEVAEFTVLDSAGVMIVLNPEQSVSSAPVLELVEDLRIGAIDGHPGEVFENLCDITVGEDGEIFAVDGRARAVRVFSPEGVLLREFGGRGGGPGEFDSAPAWVTLGRDSVVVQDLYRIHVFSRTGEFLGSTMRSPGAPGALLGSTPHSWLLGTSSIASSPHSRRGTKRDTLRIVPVDLTNGSVGVPVVEAPSGLLRDIPGMDGAVAQWNGPQAEAAMRRDGEIYVVDGSEYRIDVYSPSGQFSKSIRAAVKRIPVRGEDFEAGLAGMRSTLGFNEIKELGYPEVRPVSGRLFVAPSGRLIMNRRDLSSIPMWGERSPFWETWDLLGSNGRVLGRFTTDQRILPEVLTDERLYAIVRDELDVQYVVRYRIVGPGL